MTTTRDEILDRLFRNGSSARHVAALILDGRPHSRQELAEAANVAATTIPRVVRMLESDGIPVEKSVGDDGRTIIYRTHHDRPAAIHDGKPTTSTVTPKAVTIAGDTLTVSTTAGDYRVRIHTDGTLSVKIRDREILIA
jgi:biotin operon repressor